MTPAEFKTRFPEFAAVADQRVQMFITDADPFFDVARWDTLYPAGIANFVAHELTMADSTQTNLAKASDILTSKVGDVQKTMDTALLNKQADNPFMRTKYGQKYLYLRRNVEIGVLAV